jgi:multidrug efflux pump subunit AcrB
MYVNLKDRGERAGAGEVIERLRSATHAVNDVKLYLQPAPEVQLGVSEPATEYEYTLSSSDIEQLRVWAPRFEAAIRELPFMLDVRNDLHTSSPTVKLDIDRRMAAQLGVDTESIDDAMFQAFGQERAAKIYDDASQRYVFIQFDPSFQENEQALSFVNLRSSSGALVPLSTFAHLSRSQSQSTIRHRARLPVATINFNLASSTSLSTAVAAIRNIEQTLGLPDSVHGTFEGTAREFERSLADEPWLISGALLVVYLILGALYGSPWHPLTILSSLPSAGAGALLAIYLLHQQFTLISLIGILLLIGIVKKNAIMMVDFAVDAERNDRLSPLEAIRRASAHRFRPIMMTTLAALTGALPLALERGPGAELRNPLGLVIIGGLLVSQALTIYTTPVIYLALARIQGSMGDWLRAVRPSH